MATSYVSVKGLRELGKAARKLTDDVRLKSARDSVQAGAGVISRAARGLAPVLKPIYRNDRRRLPGTLKSAIVAVRVRKSDHPDEVMSLVGIRLLSKKKIVQFKGSSGKAGAANPRDPYYGVMVEVGSRAHRHRSKAIPGVRFLKRGLEGSAQNASEKIRDTLGKRILKYGNSLAK